MVRTEQMTQEAGKDASWNQVAEITSEGVQ
jgi:hypothetical protein